MLDHPGEEARELSAATTPCFGPTPGHAATTHDRMRTTYEKREWKNLISFLSPINFLVQSNTNAKKIAPTRSL